MAEKTCCEFRPESCHCDHVLLDSLHRITKHTVDVSLTHSLTQRPSSVFNKQIRKSPWPRNTSWRIYIPDPRTIPCPPRSPKTKIMSIKSSQLILISRTSHFTHRSALGCIGRTNPELPCAYRRVLGNLALAGQRRIECLGCTVTWSFGEDVVGCGYWVLRFVGEEGRKEFQPFT